MNKAGAENPEHRPLLFNSNLGKKWKIKMAGRTGSRDMFCFIYESPTKSLPSTHKGDLASKSERQKGILAHSPTLQRNRTNMMLNRGMNVIGKCCWSYTVADESAAIVIRTIIQTFVPSSCQLDTCPPFVSFRSLLNHYISYICS